MYKVEVSYSVILTYPTLAEAQEAQEWLFAGGADKVTIKFVPIEEAAAEEEA
jgi:hypothetical protein